MASGFHILVRKVFLHQDYFSSSFLLFLCFHFLVLNALINLELIWMRNVMVRSHLLLFQFPTDYPPPFAADPAHPAFFASLYVMLNPTWFQLCVWTFHFVPLKSVVLQQTHVLKLLSQF